MTLITKAVTHFRATFEIVLHFRTGARAPILWKMSNQWVGAANANHYHLQSRLAQPGQQKTQMRIVIIWVYWWWVAFSKFL